ncbi:MAG: MFS transporter [Thermoleophilia bacterium]|nr:MFS transporter [Thermoleophilia bacterium]
MTAALLAANRRTFASLRKHRNDRLFFAGQVVSVTGTWMQNVATAWLVLELTGSPVAVGLLALFQFLPFTLLSLPAGVLLDRLDPRRTVIATQALSLVSAAVLAALTLADVIAVWQVYVLTAFRGTVLVLDNPGRQALTFQLVGRDELPNAVALNSTLFNAARVVGPAVGGVLVATLGVGIAFALNAASFLAVLAGLVAMRERELFPLDRGEDGAPGFLRGTQEAFAYVRRTPLVAAILGAVLAVSMLAFNFHVLLPVLARETLDAGAEAFGILSAWFGAGALVGALAAATRGRASPRAFLVGAAFFGAAELVLAPLGSLAAASGVLFLTGASFTTWVANANASLQLAVPDRLRGRVLGFYFLAFNGSMPLGGLLAGWLAAVGGTRLAFAVGGAGALAATLVALAVLRGSAPLAGSPLPARAR